MIELSPMLIVLANFFDTKLTFGNMFGMKPECIRLDLAKGGNKHHVIVSVTLSF